MKHKETLMQEMLDSETGLLLQIVLGQQRRDSRVLYTVGPKLALGYLLHHQHQYEQPARLTTVNTSVLEPMLQHTIQAFINCKLSSVFQ